MQLKKLRVSDAEKRNLRLRNPHHRRLFFEPGLVLAGFRYFLGRGVFVQRGVLGVRLFGLQGGHGWYQFER